MPITPIDLQTNMNQSIEVARTQKAQDSAILEQQQFLDKETQEKSVTVDSPVEHNEDIKELTKRDESGPKGRQKKKGKKQANVYEQNKPSKTEFVEDNRIGGIIDIRK